MTETLGEQDERPGGLHFYIFEAIAAFYQAFSDFKEKDNFNTGEIIAAFANIVALLTYYRKESDRNEMIQCMLREVAKFEAEYRRQRQRFGQMGTPDLN